MKITYFIPEERKSGGKYVSMVVTILKLDELDRTIVLEDGLHISIYDISDIELISRE